MHIPATLATTAACGPTRGQSGKSNACGVAGRLHDSKAQGLGSGFLV